MDSKRTNDSPARAIPPATVPEADLRRLEESIERVLAEHQKSWDTLASLSHKINNPLTSLIGRVQLLRQRGHDDPYVCRAAEVIEESSMRVAEYLREIAAVVKERRAELRRTPAEGGDPTRDRSS